MQIEFYCRHFNELNTRELYTILKSRIEVFTLEQDCAYQDCDDKDLSAYHLIGQSGETLMAYSRILPPGVAYHKYCSIGRVLTRKPARGLTIGKQLMQRSIGLCEEMFACDIKISAQSYLERFYSDLGFIPTGDHYLEDNIPHMSMIRPHHVEAPRFNNLSSSTS